MLASITKADIERDSGDKSHVVEKSTLASTRKWEARTGLLVKEDRGPLNGRERASQCHCWPPNAAENSSS